MLNSKQIGTLLRAMEKEYGLYSSNYCVTGRAGRLHKDENVPSGVDVINVLVTWEGAAILSKKGIELLHSVYSTTGGMACYDGCFLFEVANSLVILANQECIIPEHFPCCVHETPVPNSPAYYDDPDSDLPF